ncbi:hypothetical protein SAMN04487969_101134 [Paenibacillus algorifonticola]|uniref:Phage minor structural protein, N-terminal region n=1 Tax=Paenibacillus algorifonticola TaxID=684063 RepID=A0A1I1XWK4_9BACL|nr:hypothetical protein [Paenibacillus algorifonticola]SFE11559.1 hypothetical protein SAMN04487969_101134 [Paenibacillus algorifonticola]
MYPISSEFLAMLRRHDREFKVMAHIDGKNYFDSTIVDFTVENSLLAGEEFELGTTVISQCTITLRTQDVIPANALVRPYIALSRAGLSWDDTLTSWVSTTRSWEGGMTDWLSMGEYFVDSRKKINDVWTFTCCDMLVRADVPYVSALTYPATQQAVWNEICGRLGYLYDGSVQINPSYQIQAGPAGYSMRQVLGYIASANSACVYVAKSGVIRFKTFAASAPPVFNMTTADYIRIKQLNPVKTYTRVVVTYNTEDGLTYEAGSGDDNHTLYVENPFATQAITNNLYAKLNGFTYLPVQMDARGYPQLEHGDIIGFEMQEGNSWAETFTSWDNTHLPWNGLSGYQTIALHMSFSFKGGLTMQIEAPSKSEQRSEFALEGSLTQQVNRLNANTVRYGKPYYGITHSRTQGMVIEREDHKSKLTLNSDIMDWQVNGSSALYYDAQTNKLKFTGALEAASGTFSGNLQAAGGTFTGTLNGADGSFSGTITASTFTGGTITGALIQTKEVGQFPRAVMSATDNYFGVYSNADNYVVLENYAGAPAFRFVTAGQQRALINTLLGNLEMYGDNGVYINGKNGAAEVQLDGSLVKVPSWSRFVNAANGQTLQEAFLTKAQKGIATGAGGTHNHGIPDGTKLAVTNSSGTVTGFITFSTAGSHTHEQI